MNIIALPFYYFADPYQGRPLFNASVYIGEPDLDPETDPKQVYIEDETGTLIPASSPLLTGSGGIIIDDTGKPAKAVVDGAYSIRVRDSKGDEIYYTAFMDVSTGSEGGAAFPPFTVIDEALSEAENGGNYAIDMSDDISKEITIPNGAFSDGGYFGVKVLNWTNTADVSLLVVTLDEEFEVIGGVTDSDTREIEITQNGTFYFQKIGLKWSVVQGIGEDNGTQKERADKVTVDMTSLFKPTAQIEAPLIGQNIFINSDFSYDQGSSRRPDFDQSGWICDRWYCQGVGDVIATTGLDSRGSYAEIKTGNIDNAVVLSQRIEQDLTLQGQSVNLSFLCEANSEFQDIEIAVGWYVSKGGIQSDEVILNEDFVSGENEFSNTFVVPTITVFDDTKTYILDVKMRFNLNAAGDEAIIREMKLERGEVKTLWVKATQAENEAACHRFAYIIKGSTTLGVSVDSGDGFGSVNYQLPESIRNGINYADYGTAPQIILKSPAGTISITVTDSLLYSDDRTWQIRSTSTTGSVTSVWHLNGSSKQLEYNAELSISGDTFGSV